MKLRCPDVASIPASFMILISTARAARCVMPALTDAAPSYYKRLPT